MESETKSMKILRKKFKKSFHTLDFTTHRSFSTFFTDFSPKIKSSSKIATFTTSTFLM